MYEHPRAPALFLLSFLLLAAIHMFNSAVMPGVSEVKVHHIKFDCDPA